MLKRLLGHRTESPDLSIVVGYYNMARELPRTLHTLSRQYQRDASSISYEVHVVDNGSSVAMPTLGSIGCPLITSRFDGLGSSPVTALNRALRSARGRLIALMIDGARMLSPGVLRGATRAAAISPRAVIAVHGFHLGPDLQSRSILQGYDQRQEDALLDTVPWHQDGYRLLDISVFAGSSHRGWFVNPTESNCLVMPRELWAELGFLDERFVTAGGGLVNLDVYKRACELPGVSRFLLVGEGTFHQYHGGAATGQAATVTSPNEAFDREYQQIRGEVYRVPTYACELLGELRPIARRHIATSAQALADLQA